MRGAGLQASWLGPGKPASRPYPGPCTHGQVRAIVGMHGGGLYNALFASSPSTPVVEIRPRRPASKPLGGTLFWELASMRNLSYWSLIVDTKDERGNSNVDCKLVAEALQESLGEDMSKRPPTVDRWYQGGLRPTFR